MADVRVAVIGLGSMGANHARVLRELPGARFVAVADLDAARLEVAGPEAARYQDYRDMLEREALDAVTVAVPTRRHIAVVLHCIERGLPLLVEKPLGAGLDECLRLKDAAEQRGVPLMVGHVERFNPAVREAKRRLDAGDLGRVVEARARRVGPFFERERDVGVVHDLATHDIDVLRWLLATEVESVEGSTRVGVRTPFEDALSARLQFDGGPVAALEVNWLADVKERGLTLMGDTGSLVVDTVHQEVGYVSSERVQAETVTLPGAGEAPLRNELEAFLRVARGEEPPPVGADDAVAAMRVVEALIEAARSAASVRLAVGRAP